MRQIDPPITERLTTSDESIARTSVCSRDRSRFVPLVNVVLLFLLLIIIQSPFVIHLALS